MSLSLRHRFALTLARWIGGRDLAQQLASVSVKVDDSPGWSQFGRFPHDRDRAQMQELYNDTLKAWRKNPMAWRAVAITTDYVVGEKITLSSPNADMQKFITAFWNHPQNRMAHRLEAMCDELSRAGDLFPLLFLNRQDGMSYLRFLTKDQIADVETKAGDWETELVYHQLPNAASEKLETKRWYSPDHGRSRRARAVCLHYHVNRPLGAIFGESDLATVIPWLLRYSRMLEDRVRLHWAVRAFLWFVTVPSSKVKAKQEEYKQAPEAGSIIVKDDSEEWDIKTPNLRGADAGHDLQATRNMIDAGTGYPPHWRGEAQDVNLATAQAMQEPTERHLARRQNYFVFILQDILYHAYQRAHLAQPDRWPEIDETNYDKLFTAATPDISRTDNQKLATAAKELTAVLDGLSREFTGSAKLKRLMLKLILKFAGEPQEDDFLDAVMTETTADAPETDSDPDDDNQETMHSTNGHLGSAVHPFERL